MDNDPTQATQAEVKKPKPIGLKTAIIIAVIVILGALAYSYKGLFVAATVDGGPISRLAVVNELEKTSGKPVLEALITKRLIDNEMAKKGLSVSADDINAEIKKIEDQVKAQGMTLDQALQGQGITKEYLEDQIAIQKKLEKLLSDKIQVGDAEVEKYIVDNEISIPAGSEIDYINQIRAQLSQQKLNSEAGALIESLKAQSKIRYFVSY